MRRPAEEPPATGSLERHYVEDIETAVTRVADLPRLLQVSHKMPEPTR